MCKVTTAKHDACWAQVTQQISLFRREGLSGWLNDKSQAEINGHRGTLSHCLFAPSVPYEQRDTTEHFSLTACRNPQMIMDGHRPRCPCWALEMKWRETFKSVGTEAGAPPGRRPPP
jgi:hypothetical protein